jgi:hypothetical protein
VKFVCICILTNFIQSPFERTIAAGTGYIGAPMKKILSALILVTLAAAPAVAQQRYLVSDQAAAAQAYVPYNQSRHGLDRYTVVSGGRIVGRDPDPNVRLMLIRDNVTNLP